MKARQPSKPKEGELDPKEWCFDSVPTPEIEGCFNYEYVRQLVRQNRESVPPDLTADWSKEKNVFFPDGAPDDWICNWISQTSWRDLNAHARSILVVNMNLRRPNYLASFHIQMLREYGPESLSQLFRLNCELIKDSVRRTEFGLLLVAWDYPDSAIKRAFAEWLSGQRKARQKLGLTEIKRKLPTGRGGARDRLTWLGALRFKNHYTNVPHGNHMLKVEAPYNHLPDLLEAAKKARKLLAAMLSRQITPTGDKFALYSFAIYSSACVARLEQKKADVVI